MSTAGTWKASQRTSYPGLLPAEVAVLRQWFILHETEYSSFDFNVRIGKGVDPGPNFDARIRQMSLDITRKRVDCVAYQGSAVTLIEVKKRATLGNVGQILGYKVLWQQDHPTDAAPTLLLVSSAFDADLYPVLDAHSVNRELVAFNPLLIPQRTFPKR